MQDLHWRYNYNTNDFDFVENNPNQHYEPLLKHVYTPTLVIDVNLVNAQDIKSYINQVLHKAVGKNIRIQQIIFDGTQDPVYDYNDKVGELNSIAKEVGVPCYFGVSQFETTAHKHLVEINYPSWLFVFKKQKFRSIDFAQNRKYLFSCLNRNPTYHRLLFYSMLKHNNLLDKFVYSFYNRCPYQGYTVNDGHYSIIKKLVDEPLYKSCIGNLQDFPISWANEDLGSNDHSINHQAYTDAWCNVVTETSGTISFTSEKIWKPIASGQLFLVIGAPGTLNWLKSLGFHTFSDYYDSESDLVNRMTMVVDIINEYVDNTEEWWKKNKFQIEQNYYHFHSGNVEKQILDPLIKQLNHK